MGEGGLAKCQRYYISFCSKLVNEGWGIKNPQNPVNVVYGCPLRPYATEFFLNKSRNFKLELYREFFSLYY